MDRGHVGRIKLNLEGVLYSYYRMKKFVAVLLVVAVAFSSLFAGGSADNSSSSDGTYPKGELLIWSTGQPQFRAPFYQEFLDRQGDAAKDVTLHVETIPTMADGQQRVIMYSMAGDKDSLPEVIMLDTVGLMALAKAGLLLDQTDYYTPQADLYLDGSIDDAVVDGGIYGLQDSVRPQLLFYNAKIFEEYDVDPAMMTTFDGYIEAGRLLKERSNGEVYLSWVDTTNYTWRYWGRRGLMPQAGARIWDEKGNVVIGEDEGTKLALGFLDQLYSEGLLYRTAMMQPPIYEATDSGKIATFYIGAFWDEFLRKNLTATIGDWRVMNAPVFEEVGTGGAPVSNYFCLVDTGTNEYESLIQDMWYDWQNNSEAIKDRVNILVEQNGPYSNPVSKAALEDPFWQAPEPFYGGQSFRKAEADGLENASKNMMVTQQDAEADIIISAEIEKYVAGEQTMEQAIANMDKELKLKIGRADV